MVIGATLGCLFVGVLLGLTKILSPPLALLLVVLFSGIGWADARYRGSRSALDNEQRQKAEALQDIFLRKLRAIEELDLTDPNKAEELRIEAYNRYNRDMSALTAATPSDDIEDPDA
jgi:hypothetical protein